MVPFSFFLMARTTSASSHSNKDRRWIYCWTKVSCHHYFHPRLRFSNRCHGNGWRFDIFVAWELIFVQIQSSANQMKNNNMLSISSFDPFLPRPSAVKVERNDDNRAFPQPAYNLNAHPHTLRENELSVFNLLPAVSGASAGLAGFR